MKHTRTIICAILLLAGVAIVAADGAVEWFHATRGVQYAINLGFFLVGMPLCLALGEFDKLLHPELK